MRASIETGDYDEEQILDPDTEVESLIKALVKIGKVMMARKPPAAPRARL